jgi:hypothetical protein
MDLGCDFIDFIDLTLIRFMILLISVVAWIWVVIFADFNGFGFGHLCVTWWSLGGYMGSLGGPKSPRDAQVTKAKSIEISKDDNPNPRHH